MADARHVLVVEEDADVRSLIVDLLERANYRVSQAGDGRTGLRFFHELRPLDTGIHLR